MSLAALAHGSTVASLDRFVEAEDGIKARAKLASMSQGNLTVDAFAGNNAADQIAADAGGTLCRCMSVMSRHHKAQTRRMLNFVHLQRGQTALAAAWSATACRHNSRVHHWQYPSVCMDPSYQRRRFKVLSLNAHDSQLRGY